MQYEHLRITKAISIVCFVSHRPPSCDSGSVGRAKKKKEWKEGTNCKKTHAGSKRKPSCQVRPLGYKVDWNVFMHKLSCKIMLPRDCFEGLFMDICRHSFKKSAFVVALPRPHCLNRLPGLFWNGWKSRQLCRKAHHLRTNNRLYQQEEIKRRLTM